MALPAILSSPFLPIPKDPNEWKGLILVYLHL